MNFWRVTLHAGTRIYVLTVNARNGAHAWEVAVRRAEQAHGMTAEVECGTAVAA